MLASCQKTAAELAGRVASARREQGPQVSLLEDQMRRREELLLSVKAGTDAANALKVRHLHEPSKGFLPRESPH